ncbi:FAD-dependent oxidoreductase [Sphingomonas sp. ZB1N12]|uniref:FAD-dependent oxidoreductase n=1 Tax=Sphingomonas arabinosi TaxID=3096160 RepID=UPI002FCA6E2D
MRTVVIGGGAAGIAAARTLHDAGLEVLLIEACDRLGGRAWSLSLKSLFPREGKGRDWNPSTGEHVDAGCGWLHSAQRNPWTSIAEATGFTVDRSDANWRSQWRNLGFPPEDQASSSNRLPNLERARNGGAGRPRPPPFRLHRRPRQMAPEDRRDLGLRQRREPQPSFAPRLGRIRRGLHRRQLDCERRLRHARGQPRGRAEHPHLNTGRPDRP